MPGNLEVMFSIPGAFQYIYSLTKIIDVCIFKINTDYWNFTKRKSKPKIIQHINFRKTKTFKLYRLTMSIFVDSTIWHLNWVNLGEFSIRNIYRYYYRISAVEAALLNQQSANQIVTLTGQRKSGLIKSTLCNGKGTQCTDVWWPSPILLDSGPVFSPLIRLDTRLMLWENVRWAVILCRIS